jgi:hypothetical protein
VANCHQLVGGTGFKDGGGGLARARPSLSMIGQSGKTHVASASALTPKLENEFSKKKKPKKKNRSPI